MLAILGCYGFLNCEHGDFSILMRFMLAISWVVVVVIFINMSFYHLVTDQEKECQVVKMNVNVNPSISMPQFEIK